MTEVGVKPSRRTTPLLGTVCGAATTRIWQAGSVGAQHAVTTISALVARVAPASTAVVTHNRCVTLNDGAVYTGVAIRAVEVIAAVPILTVAAGCTVVAAATIGTAPAKARVAVVHTAIVEAGATIGAGANPSFVGKTCTGVGKWITVIGCAAVVVPLAWDVVEIDADLVTISGFAAGAESIVVDAKSVAVSHLIAFPELAGSAQSGGAKTTPPHATVKVFVADAADGDKGASPT